MVTAARERKGELEKSEGRIEPSSWIQNERKSARKE